MDDQGRAGRQHGVDVFEDVRRVVDEQTDTMAPDPGIFAGAVDPEIVFAEDVVLGLGDLARGLTPAFRRALPASTASI